MPESLQTLSLSDCCVAAAFFILNGADSPSLCLDLTSAKEFRDLDLHNNSSQIHLRLPACVKKISMTCAPVDCWQVERLLAGLTALEDVHIEVCDLLAQEAGPYFTESLLQTIISAPRHYFEWQWDSIYARQVEVAEQHDVLKTYGANVMWIANLRTKPHLLFRRNLQATGFTHMKMQCILARGYNLSPDAQWEKCV